MLVQGFYNFLGWISLALLVFALFALVDAAIRRDDAYRAASKNTKAFWLIVLALAAALIAFLPITSFLPVIGLIAVIVYTVDVRPALKQISGPRRRGGSSSDGPYGPFNR
ncbi:DUF2516 family protein [Streptomyces sp. NPDC058691]|uniref:DUF2516 family protein n=1 Tax=Streptomyces sp. NPDC058691 TaxID=3346601 RepID=UPI00364F13F7